METLGGQESHLHQDMHLTSPLMRHRMSRNISGALTQGAEGPKRGFHVGSAFPMEPGRRTGPDSPEPPERERVSVIFIGASPQPPSFYAPHCCPCSRGGVHFGSAVAQVWIWDVWISVGDAVHVQWRVQLSQQPCRWPLHTPSRCSMFSSLEPSSSRRAQTDPVTPFPASRRPQGQRARTPQMFSLSPISEPLNQPGW